MPTTDALNTTGAKVYVYPEMSVYLGDGSGNAPPDTSPSVFSNVYCSRVVQSASGSRMDYAELSWRLTASLINRTQPANFARMVDVRIPTTGTETKIHRGDYVRESFRVDQQAETLTAQSQWRPYHYGDALGYYWVLVPGTTTLTRIFDDVIFNPIVDGKIRGNRSSVLRSVGGGSDVSYLWIHPECADTATGETSVGQTRSLWTLLEATKAICELLNAETFCTDPNWTAAATTLSGAPSLQNVTIPIGTRLHDALDMLLIPLGYNWYLDYTTATKPRIVLFKIGSGTTRELYFQAPNSSLNLETSNVNKFGVDNAIGDAFNQVKIVGDFERAEVTLPLYAAWDSAGDTLTPFDLRKDGSDYSEHQTTWRLFIANEAGDISTTTSRFGQTPIMPTLSSVFTYYVPHRRVLEEPLTFASGTGQPQRFPHWLEYSVDSGTTWKPAEESWSYKLCPDQIGVYFDGMDIPQELRDAGNNWRLRITGTVAGDSRITTTAAKTSNAVNGRVFEQVLSMPDKFVKRWRQTTGTYQSKLNTTGSTGDTQDDQTALDAYAVAMRNQNHFAEVDCEFRLPGWHTYYQIGDVITKIAGREISLNAAPVGSTVQRYVQIVERRFEMGPEGPSTVLIVDRGTA
jgi:hypothetical protein